MVLGAVGAAAVLLTVAAILPAGTFRAARGIPTAVGINALTSTAFLTAESVLPLLLVTHHGLSAATAGLALTFAAVGWSSASWFRGRNPFDVEAVGFLRAGSLALVIGIGGAATLTIPAVPSAVGMAAWAVTGIGMGLTSPTLSVLVLDLAEPGRQGAAASALQTGSAVVAAPALAVVGAAVWMLRDAGTWGSSSSSPSRPPVRRRRSCWRRGPRPGRDRTSTAGRETDRPETTRRAQPRRRRSGPARCRSAAGPGRGRP